MPSFTYDPGLGTLYARNFSMSDNVPPDQRLFYYDPSDNCTNFISQCVWASYGGWVPSFTREGVAENLARILGDVRQVSGAWYGSHSHIGSNIWARVEEFCSFVTNRGKFHGPRADLMATGALSALDPALLRQGDVIQLVVAPYAPNRFGHGLYVTEAGGAFDSTFICSQTQDRLDVPLSWFLQYPDIYPRQRVLRFSPAEFAK